LWEKVSPKATDEGCSRERRRLTPLEHPSSVSALRADPPSPTTRGEGRSEPFALFMAGSAVFSRYQLVILDLGPT
ncbi:MAG: hypothetical protein EOS39_27345, partial [Mesorhizobium sp.]